MMPVSFDATFAAEAMKNKGDADSRSTSAGSRSSCHESREPSQVPSNWSLCDLSLPEYEYPVPLLVRNTFIDTETERPLSLHEFFEERRIHSCPPAALTPESEDNRASTAPAHARLLRRAVTSGTQVFAAAVSMAVGVAATATGFLAGPEQAAPAARLENAFPAVVPEQGPRVIMLSEALPEPALGSSEFPTVGSAGHYTGFCKPCAFFHARGCDKGFQCAFCHLCGPHEKRHRRKAKVTALREARRQEQAGASREVQR